jgi:hypothetical protein
LSQNLNQILDFFPEHLGLRRVGLLVKATDFSTVDLTVVGKSVGDKVTLKVGDVFLALADEKFFRLGLMVVLELCPIKYPVN